MVLAWPLKILQVMQSSRKGPWAMSNMKPVKVAMPNRFYENKGLFSLLDHYEFLAEVL
jgi:hypothetical protein